MKGKYASETFHTKPYTGFMPPKENSTLCDAFEFDPIEDGSHNNLIIARIYYFHPPASIFNIYYFMRRDYIDGKVNYYFMVDNTIILTVNNK